MIRRQWLQLIGGLLPLLVAAQVGTWEHIPTPTQVRDFLVLGDTLWLATDGGVLGVAQTTDSVFMAPWNDLLPNPDAWALATDNYGRLWVGFGAPGELVHIVSPTGEDVAGVSRLEVDGISALAVSGDSLFAVFKRGVEGGLLYFRAQAGEVRYLDILENFPTAATGLDEIFQLIITGDYLAFITPTSLVWAPLKGSNLKDPSVWQVRTPPPGQSTFLGIARYENGLLVASDDSLYVFDFNVLKSVGSLPAGAAVFRQGADGAYYLAADSLYRLEPTVDFGFHGQTALPDYALFEVSPQGIWIAGENYFLKHNSADGWRLVAPNAPVSHTFLKSIVLPDGRFVGVSRKGISILSSQGWRNIVAGSRTVQHSWPVGKWSSLILDTLAAPVNVVPEDLKLLPDGEILISLQGKGVLRLNVDSLETAVMYDVRGGYLSPTYDSDTYTLPRAVAVDSTGNIWLTSALIRSGDAAISIVTPEDSVWYIPASVGEGIATRAPNALAIDSRNRVWVGGQVAEQVFSGGGLYVLENYQGPEQLDVAYWVSFVGSPLAHNDIRQLIVDQNDYLWILSAAGVQVMPLPERTLTAGEWSSYIKVNLSPTLWELTGHDVTAMALDGRDNIWFLTAEGGVYGRQENGTWINGGYGYQTDNSGLLDNQVFTAAFDAGTGYAYFSTAKGLSRLQTPFASPRTDYSAVKLFPQPFRPALHGKLIIQGLMDNSTVRIFTVNGDFIRELSGFAGTVEGFEAWWDGRDSRGRLVNSGVYLLLLYDAEGHKLVTKAFVAGE